MARGDRDTTGRGHRAPAWWLDAKFGIFVHWTPASVPGFAPVDIDITELFATGHPEPLAASPYTEWYENSLRFPDSPASRHHREHHGDRPYRSFAPDFEAGLESWDPDAWARAFRDAGARYVVLVTKHHDGYCLWPSSVPNPNLAGWHTTRDVVGELAEAVRGVGLRFGVYYSGGLDWTFDDRPLATFSDLIAAAPRGTYLDYAEAHVEELVVRYRPEVLWNDISWPTDRRRLRAMLARYYRAVPEGVVNDRWSPRSPLTPLLGSRAVGAAIDAGVRRGARRGAGIVPPDVGIGDYRTPEYTVFDTIRPKPWETVRGMDHSFGYNRMSRDEHFIDPDELARTVVDAASKNGNLLLNVGPRGEDATIPDPQLERLAAVGELLGRIGPAVRATRPWVRPAATSAEGLPLRFTARDTAVGVAVLSRPEGEWLTVPDVRVDPGATATWSGEGAVEIEALAGAVRFRVPAGLPDSPVHALVVEGMRALPVT